MTPLFKVLKSASQATVQDMGRERCMHDGVAPGGAMDIHAHAWANRLLGQAISHPSIEITLGLFKLHILSDCVISLTGADLDAHLNGESISPWRTYYLRTDDVLEFGAAKTGVSAYLGIAYELANAERGRAIGLGISPSYASLSTVVREHRLGLKSGCLLQRGDVLQAKSARIPAKFIQAVVPEEFIPSYTAKLELELLPCYQFANLDESYKNQFFKSQFEIQPSSNRMAYLLEQSNGGMAKHSLSRLASEANAYGSVQIPPDGNLVVLLNDRQTVGGYPRIGTISRLSGAKLCQRMAPAQVTFKPISFEHLCKTILEFDTFFST